MSREILFRGQDFGGSWHVGSLDNRDEKHPKIFPHNLPALLVYVKPETVGQYTNRDAVNGKIFEGDILQTPAGALRVVESTGTELVIRSMDGRRSTWAFARSLKIVGNIWDNPEILKGTRYEKK